MKGRERKVGAKGVVRKSLVSLGQKLRKGLRVKKRDKLHSALI